MRVSRRIAAWLVLFAIAIGVVVMMVSRDGERQGTQGAEDAPLLIDDPGLPGQAVSISTPADDVTAAWHSRSSELSRESSDARCVQLVSDAATFAETAQIPGAAAQDEESHNDWLIAEVDKLHRRAVSVRDPEMLLASLLLQQQEQRSATDAAAQGALLEFGAQAARSGSAVLAWHALGACADAGQSCPFAHLEQSLLDLQRENAEAWALVALLKHQRGDVAGALAAMQGAARAKTATWHWPETIALVERTLAVHSPIAYPDRTGLALAAGVRATPAAVTRISSMCRTESASSRAWAEACLAFGTVRQERNETEMGMGLAHGIRRQALTALGETELAAEAQARYERFSAERMAGGQELMVAAARLQAALINTDGAKLHAYLGAVRELGETAGRRQFFRQEAPALLDRAGLLGREAARECVAELFLEAKAAGETRQAILDYRLQPGDELHISLRGNNRGSTLTRRIGPDGKLMLGRGLSMTAAGMTTEQFQRELAAASSQGGQLPEALVIPIARRPPEELRTAFEDAARPSLLP